MLLFYAIHFMIRKHCKHAGEQHDANSIFLTNSMELETSSMLTFLAFGADKIVGENKRWKYHNKQFPIYRCAQVNFKFKTFYQFVSVRESHAGGF